MENLALVIVVVFTALPYAIGVALSVFRQSPIPLLAAMLVQRIGFIVFLAMVLHDSMGSSSLSGIVLLCCFLLASGTSAQVLKPMMDIIMAHLVAQRQK